MLWTIYNISLTEKPCTFIKSQNDDSQGGSLRCTEEEGSGLKSPDQESTILESAIQTHTKQEIIQSVTEYSLSDI